MNRVRLILLLTCAISSQYISVECLEGESIIGGDLAEDDQFKYAVSVQSMFGHFCGGSIIGDRYVLTAAHCVINEEEKFKGVPLLVAVGTTDASGTSRSGTKVLVNKIFVPRVYKRNNPDPKKLYRPIGDIAVLRLNQPLGLNKNPSLRKLNLPQDKYTELDGEEATIAGYGYTTVQLLRHPITNQKYEEGKSDHQLRFAETRVISAAECGKYFKAPLQSSHLCARVKQRDAENPAGVCSGDSGGALVLNDTVIGVVSSGPLGCLERASAGVYTRVSSFLGFVKNAMKNKATADMRSLSFPYPADARP